MMRVRTASVELPNLSRAPTETADLPPLESCRFSPDMGPVIFGKDGPLFWVALAKPQMKKRLTIDDV